MTVLIFTFRVEHLYMNTFAQMPCDHVEAESVCPLFVYVRELV